MPINGKANLEAAFSKMPVAQKAALLRGFPQRKLDVYEPLKALIENLKLCPPPE